MNKTELIESMAGNACISKKEAEKALNAFIGAVESELKKGKDVVLTGFGKFTTTKRAARTGRNPQTGKPMEIPAKITPKFVPGKGLKDAIK